MNKIQYSIYKQETGSAGAEKLKMIALIYCMIVGLIHHTIHQLTGV